jgi:hypothetical protein
MNEWAVAILLTISNALGVSSLPDHVPSDWTLEHAWQPHGDYLQLKASNHAIIAACQATPYKHIVFPLIVHGAHEYFVDGKWIGQFGDTSFKTVESFYAKPSLPCSALHSGSTFTWQITAYSHYFARFTSFPEISEAPSSYNLFAYSFHALAGGMLLILGAFASIVSWGKVNREMLLSFAIATLTLPLYFIPSTAGFFGAPGSMLQLHRIADIGLWIGASGIFWFLHAQGLFGKALLRCFLGSAGLAVAILAFAPSGDVAQLGTTIPFLVAPFVLTTSLFNLWGAHRKGQQFSYTIVRLVEIFFFVVVSLFDILFVLGLTAGPHFSPLACSAFCFSPPFRSNNKLNKPIKNETIFAPIWSARWPQKQTHFQRRFKT